MNERERENENERTVTFDLEKRAPETLPSYEDGPSSLVLSPCDFCGRYTCALVEVYWPDAAPSSPAYGRTYLECKDCGTVRRTREMS